MCESEESWPISRVLCLAIAYQMAAIPLWPLSPMVFSGLPGNHAGGMCLAAYFLFGLASGGVYPAACVTASAVRSYRTISPLPLSAVYFLWHFPWTHAPQGLPGTLPYEARTFLPIHQDTAAARPTLLASVYFLEIFCKVLSIRVVPK